MIMDLTVGRLVQVRDVILTRRRYRHRREIMLEEMKIRTLTSHMAANAGNKAGMAAAERITFLPGERANEPVSMERAARVFGGIEPLTDEQLQAIAAGATSG